MYLQGIIQIMEEMAIAMETAVFSSHLQVASAAVLCNLIPVDELADLVRIMISDQVIYQILQVLRYRHIGSDEARTGADLTSIKAWQVVANRAELESFTRSE